MTKSFFKVLGIVVSAAEIWANLNWAVEVQGDSISLRYSQPHIVSTSPSYAPKSSMLLLNLEAPNDSIDRQIKALSKYILIAISPTFVDIVTSPQANSAALGATRGSTECRPKMESIKVNFVFMAAPLQYVG